MNSFVSVHLTRALACAVSVAGGATFQRMSDKEADDEQAETPHPGRLSDYVSLGVIARVYRRDLVDEVIAETRSKEKRTRLLPARLVVYYVIALALFFGEAYEEVMRK